MHYCKCSYKSDKKSNFDQHRKTCTVRLIIEDLEERLKVEQEQNRVLTGALIGKSPDSQSEQLLDMLNKKDAALREKDAEIARLNQQLQSHGQTNVNITNNVTVNVVFGEESLAHIRPSTVLELMQKRSPKSVAAFIRMIYEEPTNATIQKPNLSRPYYLVSRGNGYVHEHQDTLFRELYLNNKTRMTVLAQRGKEEVEDRVNAETREEVEEEKEEMRKAMEEAGRRAQNEMPDQNDTFVDIRKEEIYKELEQDILRKRKRESQAGQDKLRRCNADLRAFQQFLPIMEKGMNLTQEGWKQHQKPKIVKDDKEVFDKGCHEAWVHQRNLWKEFNRETEKVLNDILRPNRK